MNILHNNASLKAMQQKLDSVDKHMRITWRCDGDCEQYIFFNEKTGNKFTDYRKKDAVAFINNLIRLAN